MLVAALVLAASSATAADDPAKALDGLLKPDPASPLGGTLTGLQYTGFGLSHVKKADIPKFDRESVLRSMKHATVRRHILTSRCNALVSQPR